MTDFYAFSQGDDDVDGIVDKRRLASNCDKYVRCKLFENVLIKGFC